MTAVVAGWPSPAVVVTGLRWWSAGFAADEAAVELLACVARDVSSLLQAVPETWEPWIVPCPRPGWWSLDGTALAENLWLVPESVRPVVSVIAALVSDGALIDLGVTLAAVPQPWLGPVFAALGHAAGCPRLELRPVDGTEPGLFGWRDTVAGVALPPTRARYEQVQCPYLVPDAPVVRGGRRVG